MGERVHNRFGGMAGWRDENFNNNLNFLLDIRFIGNMYPLCSNNLFISLVKRGTQRLLLLLKIYHPTTLA